MDKPIRILIIDDEAGMRLGCQKVLQKKGYEVDVAATGKEGIEKIKTGNSDLALVDYKLPDVDGMKILEEAAKTPSSPLCIMITAYATLESAVSATKKGAYDFLAKPFTPAELNASVNKAVEYVKLQREAERLKEEKKRVRLEFVRIVSHELKAPLAAIEGYLNNLLSGFVGDSKESREKVLKRCKSRAEGMRKLIQDLLDMTRVETGTKQRELQEFDLSELLRDVIEVFEPQSADKGIELNFSDHDLPAMHGDPGELRIVFTNLLSNAIKYNKKGGKVDLVLRADDKYVLVSVSDNGIGMKKEELNKLFTEFYRAKNEHTRTIPGTGLGLSIVKKLVTLNHGEIEVDSEYGEGAKFTVRLPVRQPDDDKVTLDSSFKY